MPKKIYFWIALGWTLVIAFLCLVSFNELPEVDIELEDADKYVHAGFHFLFTVLWYLHFRQRFPETKNKQLLTGILVFSIAYGILIEVFQQLFTTTRQADLKDVLANLTGAVLAVLVLVAASKIFQKRHT